MKTRIVRIPLTVIVLGIVTGCKGIGPGTLPRDRYEYSSSISESWKRQALLNIVKLRYLDPPIFVDVGQIVAGYTLETGLSAGASLPGQGNSTVNLGGSAKWTDRPTITYTPLTGNKFVKSLMTPLSPEGVFSTLQAGWPADGVLFAALASINGLKNQETSLAGVSPPDPEFLRVLVLMRNIQRSGAVGFRVKQDLQKPQPTLLTFRTKDITPQTLDEVHELRRLLHLDPDATEFNLVVGTTASNDREVAVVTRSLLHLLSTMASQVEVPADDLAHGAAIPGWESLPAGPGTSRLIEIRSSQGHPHHASVAISYRDHWFWIDDYDLKSKRVFAFMMMLFTLADTGDKENLPVLTIPTQ
jgi:hypothetical protein